MNTRTRIKHFRDFFTTLEKEKYKLIFDDVWDARYGIENAFIERWANFNLGKLRKSNVLMVKNSKYIAYFENPVSGTRPVGTLKDYIISDEVDTVFEILTNQEPRLVKMDEEIRR